MIQKKSPSPVQNSKKLNKDILLVTYIFLGLFLILVGYFAYLTAFSSQKQINNPYNKLINLASNSVVRGNIYSSDGKLLATTAYDDDNEEYRYYPYGEEYCHVIGSIDKGLYGLEAAYNFELLSSNDSILTKIGNDLSDKKDNGNSIVTTLDSKIQDAAFEALKPYDGAVIVMNSKTGAILAMVSNPGYDPNKISEEWDSINSESSSVLLNRATQGLYTPGSVFKVITLYEYLSEGNTEDSYNYDCSGSITIDGEVIHCINGQSHGSVNLRDSFAYSCNCSFVNIGKQISSEKLFSTCENLLFNQKLPVKLSYKQSSFTLKKDSSDFLKSQTVFGQGETLMSPIHAAIITQAIANNGVAMEPRFVESMKDTSDHTIKTYGSKTYKTLFQPEMAEKLKAYMGAVVEYGTAERLNHYSTLTVYGKTGSAEIDSERNINSWFMGFAENANTNENYTIVVVAENVASGTSPAPSVTIANQILKVLD